MTAKLIRSAAWLCLLAILFVTVAPIDLRPRNMMPVNVDRAVAFAAMAGLFTLAYPRQAPRVLLLTVVCALLIEVLQYLAPSRHARLADALFKALGAAAGVGIGRLLLYVVARVGRSAQLRATEEEQRDMFELPEGDDPLTVRCCDPPPSSCMVQCSSGANRS